MENSKSQKPLSKAAMMSKMIEDYCMKNGIKCIEGIPNKNLYTVSFRVPFKSTQEKKDNSAKDSQKE